MEHYSVLLNEAIENLNIKENGIYVDATLGLGGHSSKILEKLREKQESSFVEEMKKHEQRELDEFKYYPLFISKKGDH